MKRVITITPQLRVQLMHAETIEIEVDDSSELAEAKGRIAQQQERINAMFEQRNRMGVDVQNAATTGHVPLCHPLGNQLSMVAAMRAKLAELEEAVTMAEAERAAAQVNHDDCAAELEAAKARIAELERQAATMRLSVDMLRAERRAEELLCRLDDIASQAKRLRDAVAAPEHATASVDRWPTEDDYNAEYEEFKEGDNCTGRIDDAFRAGWCAYEDRTAPMRSARRLLAGGE